MPIATNQSGNLLPIKDCYIEAAGVRITLDNLPDISDTHSADYQSEAGIGRSLPSKTFTAGGDRSIGWNMKFLADSEAKLQQNLLQLRFLQSLTYPRTSTSSLPFIPPAIAKIKCGSLLGNDPLCVVLTNYSVKFPTDVPWSETSYVPYKFEVDLSFVVVYDSGNLPGAERIITLGN